MTRTPQIEKFNFQVIIAHTEIQKETFFFSSLEHLYKDFQCKLFFFSLSGNYCQVLSRMGKVYKIPRSSSYLNIFAYLN